RCHGALSLLRALSAGAAPRMRLRDERAFERVDEVGSRAMDHRRLAVRADLPQRLERRLAGHACLLQPRRADGADEERRLDGGAADRALALSGRQPLLDRADLEIPFPHLVEILGRAEEHVDQRADERQRERDQRRERDQPPVGDAPPRVLVRPERDGEPEDDADRDQARARERPGAGGEEVGERWVRQEGGRHYNSSLPIMYPAVNVNPTKAPRMTTAKK